MIAPGGLHTVAWWARRAVLMLVPMLVAGALVTVGAALAVGGCATPGQGPGADPDSTVQKQIPIRSLEVVNVEKGTVHRLSEHGTRPLLIYFFTTWCLPCTEDMHLLLDLHRKYHGDGLQVVGVAMDLDPGLTVPAYVDYWKLPFPVYGATEQMVQGRSMLGQLYSLPLSLFVDKKGRLVASHPGQLPPEITEKAVLRLLTLQ